MPYVVSINLSYESIGSLMAKLRADKASGPDSVAPKLLTFTGDSIIPFLLSVFNISATCNTVPATMKVTVKLLSRSLWWRQLLPPMSLDRDLGTITSGRIEKVIPPSCC